MAPFRSFRKKNRFDKILINSLLAGALLFAISGPIRELFIWTLKSFTSVNQSVSQSTTSKIEEIVNSKNLIKSQSQKIADLTTELNSCKDKLHTAARLAQKVETIDRLLKIKREYFPQSVAAKIIARSPSSWHQELIIDKGSRDKIKSGMIAITSRGILGQIQDVEASYSVVQLVSSSQIRFGAMLPRSNVMGILFGNRGGYAQLKFVPIGSDVQKGDLVQTTSISPNGVERMFPVAYPVGKVIEVSKDDNNSEMFIRVKLFEDGSKMSDVLVLLPGGNKPLGRVFELPPEETQEIRRTIETAGNSLTKPVTEIPVANTAVAKPTAIKTASPVVQSRAIQPMAGPVTATPVTKPVRKPIPTVSKPNSPSPAKPTPTIPPQTKPVGQAANKPAVQAQKPLTPTTPKPAENKAKSPDKPSPSKPKETDDLDDFDF